MKRLSEEQLIDIALGEPHPEAWDAVLDNSPEDQARLAVLRDGLRAARKVEPRVPPMPLPPISYQRFKRRAVATRLAWLAAAAMLLFSLMGLRVEVGPDGMALQFSIFGGGPDQETEERIAVLEERLIEAIELRSALAQSQIDARFNAFFAERDQDLSAFSQALEVKMTDLEVANAQYLTAVVENVAEMTREREQRGKLQ